MPKKVQAGPARHGATLRPDGRMVVIESNGDPTVGVIVDPPDLAGLAVRRPSVQGSYWRRTK